MSLRAPSIFRKALENPLEAALQQEILSEKANALTRQTKKLETVLARLAETPPDTEAHATCQALAAEALWMVTIQRDLCGLSDHRAFYDLMGVPKSLRLIAGPMVKQPPLETGSLMGPDGTQDKA